MLTAEILTRMIGQGADITIRPTFVYHITTGKIRYVFNGDVDYVLATGYSGFGVGKNNLCMCDIEMQGPVCVGLYTFGRPENSPTHGPVAMKLIPDPMNTMYGRSEFMVHGDSVLHPGFASHGCIIAPRSARDFMALKWSTARLIAIP